MWAGLGWAWVGSKPSPPGYPHPALIIIGFVNKICLRVLGQL